MKLLLLVCCIVHAAHAAQLSLTFATYNIRYQNDEDRDWRWWPNRLHRLVKTVRSMNPDVWGVQEAMHAQVADLALSFPDYEFYGVGRDDGKTQGEYTGIFYRRDRFVADLSDAGTFWLSDTPTVPGSKTWGNSIPRIAAWLHLRDRKTDRSFTVYNTHWDHRNQESRERAALLIAQRIDQRKHAQEPVVLLGDFNATEGNGAVDYLAGRNKKWSRPLLDTFYTLHPEIKSRRTLHFWNNNRDGWAKVDHILVSRPCKVTKAGIFYPTAPEPPASDHFPVYAQIIWP